MSTPTPQVSVILPVYNGAQYVTAAIRSILEQDADLKILVHDDGSTDATSDLLQQLVVSEPQIDLSTGANRGPAAARNVALARARGEFIAFMDHDDLWPAGRLKRQLDMLTANEAAAGVLGHTFIFDTTDSSGKPLHTARSRRVLTGLLQAGLFRREAIVSAGGLDTALRAADDLDLLLRVIERGGVLAVDPEIAVYYRIHPGQWTADLERTSLQTVRALVKSLSRRRHGGTPPRLNWRQQ